MSIEFDNRLPQIKYSVTTIPYEVYANLVDSKFNFFGGVEGYCYSDHKYDKYDKQVRLHFYSEEYMTKFMMEYL